MLRETLTLEDAEGTGHRRNSRRTRRAPTDRAGPNDEGADRGRGPIARLAQPAAIAVAFLAFTGSASAQHGGGMMGGGGYGGVGFPGFGLLFWVLLAGGIVMLVGYARNNRSARDPTSASGNRALETLRERYARGDLSTEEFESRRAELERSR